jgi:hypothetical protein
LRCRIIPHCFGREWVEKNVIQDEKRSRPAGFFRVDFSSDFEREKKTFCLLDFAETASCQRALSLVRTRNPSERHRKH